MVCGMVWLGRAAGQAVKVPKPGLRSNKCLHDESSQNKNKSLCHGPGNLQDFHKCLWTIWHIFGGATCATATAAAVGGWEPHTACLACLLWLQPQPLGATPLAGMATVYVDGGPYPGASGINIGH